MEAIGIAVSILGIALSIGFAYIWKTNGNLLKIIGEGQKNIAKMMEGFGEGQRYMVKMIETLAEGQREIAAGHKEIAQMLLNQTKILERMETRVAELKT